MKEKDKKIIFHVDNEDQGLRVDKFLDYKNLGISRSKIQKLINSGKVKSSGLVISKNYLLKGNEAIEIEDINLPVSEYQYKPQNIKLKIIYEDDYLLAVSKDAGVVVHPAPGHHEDTLINALINYDDRLSGIGGNSRAGIVHRLDKDTSGIILIAKDEKTHVILSEKFKQREIEKTYEALVLGNFKEPAGIINMPIGRSLKDRKKMGITIKGRESITNFKIIRQFNGCSLVEAYPKTGRTHQIRVHFSYIGHPVIGDKDYGNKETEKIAKEIGLKRQFLHAKRIIFIHPVSSRQIDLSDTLSPDLSECIVRLNEKFAL